MRVLVTLEYDLPVEGLTKGIDEHNRFRAALVAFLESSNLPGQCKYATLDSDAYAAQFALASETVLAESEL